ncbi:hypothetical protein [Paenibacillus polymyxa]|uniref:hypothetical protein n=1 Tax=Paenibacillus polymyxa TaxID=1406 RepID=UPI003DA80533
MVVTITVIYEKCKGKDCKSHQIRKAAEKGLLRLLDRGYHPELGEWMMLANFPVQLDHSGDDTTVHMILDHYIEGNEVSHLLAADGQKIDLC